MAITKILARNGGLKQAISYVMNGDKTEEQLLVATQICSQSTAFEDMIATKQMHGKEDGVQCYHLIQSFKPGEVSPEQAFEIAQELVQEVIPDHEAVIGVHVDREHIHAHIVFNSVAWTSGEKYNSTKESYYAIRKVSDRLCQEHGLSVLPEQSQGRSSHYGEWLRQQKGHPTYRSMLEADLRIAMEDANDLGHFYMIMESMGYEIKHGDRLGFRFKGQEQFYYPERQNPQYSEKGIRHFITRNLQDIEAGLKPVYIIRQPYVPYQKKRKVKYTGFMALVYYYMYLLGSIQKQQYPPRMTYELRKAIMEFEELKVQFKFLRDHDIETQVDMDACVAECKEKLEPLIKQRTILNVRKKKHRELYNALSTEQELALPAKLYEEGNQDFLQEAMDYREAVKLLDSCEIPREQLQTEKAALYKDLAELNYEIRQIRKDIKMCEKIQNRVPAIEKTLKRVEPEPQKKRQKVRER